MFVLLPPSQLLSCCLLIPLGTKKFPQVRSVWSSVLSLIENVLLSLDWNEDNHDDDDDDDNWVSQFIFIFEATSTSSWWSSLIRWRMLCSASTGTEWRSGRSWRRGGPSSPRSLTRLLHSRWRPCSIRPGHPHPYNPTINFYLSSNHQSQGHISTIMELSHKIEKYTWRLQLTAAVERLPTTLKVTLEVKRESGSWRSSPPRCGSWSRSGRSKRRWRFYISINIFTVHQLTIIINFITRWGWGKLSWQQCRN